MTWPTPGKRLRSETGDDTVGRPALRRARVAPQTRTVACPRARSWPPSHVDTLGHA
jgi:hypothetical protein